MRAVLLALLLAGGPLRAQTGSAPQAPTVITVTGYPLPPGTVPAAVTVLAVDPADAGRPQGSFDVLSSSALLNVGRNGAVGGFSNVTIRGGKPNFTAVMVDGIEINDIGDSLGGAVDLSAVSTGNIQQVEIVRGPLSAVYGSDAVSGVINLVSRSGEGRPWLDLTAETGSFWTRSAGLSSGGTLGKSGYSFSGNLLGVGEQVKNDPYRLGTANFHSGTAIAGDKFLAVTAWFANSITRGYPVGGGGPEYSLVQQSQRADATQFLLGVRFDQRAASFWNYGITFDIFDRGQDLAIPPILDRIPPSFQSIPATDGVTSFRRYRGSFQNAFRISKSLSAHVTGGLRHEGGRRDTMLAGTIPDRYELERTDAYAAGDLLYTAGPWTANAGLRVDRDIVLGGFYSPRAGLSYSIVPGRLRFHGTWGKGFKLPSFYALSDPLVGNKAIQPEFNTSVDAGVSADLLARRLSVDMVWFRNQYRNLIDFSAQQFRLVNRGQVDTQGVELEAKARVTRRVGLRGSYSYLDWTLNPATEPYRDVPHWRAAGGIAWNPSQRWQWGVEALAVGRRSDFQLPVPLDTTVGGYSTLSLHGRWEISDRLTAFLRADNLLNAHYHYYVGFPDPGIYVRAGFTCRLRKP